MARWHKIKAKNRRRLLIDVLGGRCVVPSCRVTNPKKLTFDLIKPKGHEHHKGSTDQRMDFYTKELANDNLQLLCQRHNGMKGDMDNDVFMAQFESSGKNNEPF